MEDKTALPIVHVARIAVINWSLPDQTPFKIKLQFCKCLILLEIKIAR